MTDRTNDTPKTEGDKKPMSYLDHLIELRHHLIRALQGVFLILLILIFFRESIYLYVAEPLVARLPEGANLISIRIQDNFLTPIRLVVWLSFYITIPWTFYQIWKFITPGLYHHEKEIAVPLLVASVFLFYIGVLFAYFVVMPLAFGFFTTQQISGSLLQQDINELISLILLLFFAFGIAFEVPIVVILLTVMKVISPEKIARSRPYVIIGAFVIGAIITPPDAISQVLFASIVLLLFEVGLWFSKRLEAKRGLDRQEPLVRLTTLMIGFALLFMVANLIAPTLYRSITQWLTGFNYPFAYEERPIIFIFTLSLLAALPWIHLQLWQMRPFGVKRGSFAPKRESRPLFLILATITPLLFLLLWWIELPPFIESKIWGAASIDQGIALERAISERSRDLLTILFISNLPLLLLQLYALKALPIRYSMWGRIPIYALTLLFIFLSYRGVSELSITILLLPPLTYEAMLYLQQREANRKRVEALKAHHEA